MIALAIPIYFTCTKFHDTYISYNLLTLYPTAYRFVEDGEKQMIFQLPWKRDDTG